MATRLGIGALTLAFVDPLEARQWVDEYYSIIKSGKGLPIGHTVNTNIAMVTSFSLHQNIGKAISRGLEGFDFFGCALGALHGFGERKPGRTNLFKQSKGLRKKQLTQMPVKSGRNPSLGSAVVLERLMV